ncbi:MAG: LysM peptidoglycan-binding domain-containing protein, partial [Parapedobacter sp.]
PGQRLRVHSEKGKSSTDKYSKQASSPSYITYRVKKGDTLSGIAKQHRTASVSEIKALNGLKGNQIKPGMTLKINVN